MDKEWTRRELEQCLELIDHFGSYPNNNLYEARMNQALQLLIYCGIQELINAINNKQ